MKHQTTHSESGGAFVLTHSISHSEGDYRERQGLDWVELDELSPWQSFVHWLQSPWASFLSDLSTHPVTIAAKIWGFKMEPFWWINLHSPVTQATVPEYKGTQPCFMSFRVIVDSHQLKRRANALHRHSQSHQYQTSQHFRPIGFHRFISHGQRKQFDLWKISRSKKVIWTLIAQHKICITLF